MKYQRLALTAGSFAIPEFVEFTLRGPALA
jgi:hypothetical protein